MRVSLVSGDEVEVAEHSGDRALHGDGRGGVVDAPASPRRERRRLGELAWGCSPSPLPLSSSRSPG